MYSPEPIQAPICTRSSFDGLIKPSVAAMPDVTPIIPRILPIRDVVCDDKPVSAPTQHNDAARYVI